ncbi:MAG: TonB-dependent receptor, partial [Acidobacteriota bacterium]
QDLRLHRLEASDDYRFLTSVADPVGFAPSDQFETDYSDAYTWLTHQAVLARSLALTSTLSLASLSRDRFGIKNPTSDDFSIQDLRSVRRGGLRQDWNLQLAEVRQLRWGFDVRHYTVNYFYSNTAPSTRTLDAIFPSPEQALQDDIAGEQGGAYVSTRWRPRSFLTLDAGLRYDHTAFAEDGRSSPRVAVAAALGSHTVLRAAWGQFHQSQRPYELQVPDGETTFSRSELSRQASLGLDRALGSQVTLGLDAYWRAVSRPRALFENLYKPISRFPEIENDRILVAPERRRGYGLETTLRGAHSHFDWQLTYTHARVIDALQQDETPGRYDRPHSLRLDATYRTPWQWSLRLIFAAHSGRPTTPLSGRATSTEDGSVRFEPIFGSLHSDRLPTYHRLDLQAHRSWSLWKLQLDAYLGIENFYDHDNVRGLSTDFAFQLTPSGEVDVTVTPELDRGRTASFGIRLDF